MLDEIDPDGCITFRLFRRHCTYYRDMYVKDLRMLGRDLKNVILLDNSPNAYKFQPENGVPIKDFFFDTTDNSLQIILPFLETLAAVIHFFSTYSILSILER